MKRSHKRHLINYQILLTSCLTFACETKGEFDISSSVSWGLFLCTSSIVGSKYTECTCRGNFKVCRTDKNKKFSPEACSLNFMQPDMRSPEIPIQILNVDRAVNILSTVIDNNNIKGEGKYFTICMMPTSNNGLESSFVLELCKTYLLVLTLTTS